MGLLKDYLAPGRAQETPTASSPVMSHPTPTSERRKTSVFQNYLVPGRVEDSPSEPKSTPERRKGSIFGGWSSHAEPKPTSERRKTSIFQDYLTPGRTQEAKAADDYRKTRLQSVRPALPEIDEKEIGLDDEKAGVQVAVAAHWTGDEAMSLHATSINARSMIAPSTHASSLNATSFHSSIFPVGDFRNNGVLELRDIKCDVMVNWLYQQQMEMLWTAGDADEGVVLKKGRGAYTCCPPELMDEPYGFFRAVEALNVKAAMSVNTRVIKLFLHNNTKPFVPLKGGLRLQVLPDMTYLPRCQKHQFAAFIADRGILIVWDDEPKHLLNRAENIEKALIALIWGEGGDLDSDNDDLKCAVAEDWRSIDGQSQDWVPRSPVLIQPFMTALTIMATLAAMGSGWRHIAVETVYTPNWLRILFILLAPLQIWLGVFFFQALIVNVLQIIGPVSQMNANSKYFSGIAPRRLTRAAGPLPHVTIQMPVYKERLAAVIEPTIISLKAAISTYEMQGGTANVFVNDDGMQLISQEEAQERRDFYEEHNVGWVSRPRHDPEGQHGAPFTRRGKFKKASNMNYALWVSTRIEDKLRSFMRDEDWTVEQENAIYEECLDAVVEEDEGRTWADGNIRVGDYILIVDSDTRVPADCLIDAVSELETSPDVAILQEASGVMNVTDSFFEKGITFFTNLVYTQIRFAVASGDVAPFVGHNAFLRWSAMQSIVYDCKDDLREKWWSEATVSEDFDMALRLQSNGYLSRLGGYTNGGFQEGVSLTVYDELSRWEKYAFGCSELIFHPFKDWFRKGPFTKLFRNFVKSRIPLPSKITIMAYIGTYYALASAWILTLANYFLVGWFNGHLDHYYLDSFRVYVAIIVVFTLMGNVALAVLRYRIEEQALFSALIHNFTYLPMMTIYLGGVSLHVSHALLSHLFSIEMNWGATAKEAVDTSFFQEIPRIMKQFKWTFLFCFFGIAAMIVCRFALPPFWRIDTVIAIYPLCAVVVSHVLLPIALNPGLMQFTF